jgi:hypothetical protein
MPSSVPDRVRAAIPTALLTIFFLLALPALAAAATVEVRETGNSAVLELQGDGADDNVTIEAPGNGTPGFIEVKIKDSAGLTGCTGGTTKTCTLRRPQAGVFTTTIRVLLGGGDNSLETLAFTGAETTEIGIEASAGAGEDKVTTGATPDTVDPGAGEDEVRTNSNNDRVLATPQPDAADLYVLGGGFDQVSYRPRTAPVQLAGNSAGAAGENDNLAETEEVLGGAGNDTLEPSTTIKSLDGGPGNDALTGGEETDTLFGGTGNDVLLGNEGDDILEGGEGDDTMSGNSGDDRIDEDRQEAEADHLWAVGLAPGQTGGNDIVDGGEGNDQLDLGPGQDRGTGGAGIDLTFGGADNDEIDGGLGDDGVAGEGGADTLFGGSGFDEVLAGHLSEPRFEAVQPVDSWRDTVDCGPNFDVAVANRWDSVTACEHVRTVPLLELRRVKRNVRRGTARLGIALVGPGKLNTIGGGVKFAAKEVAASPPEGRSAVSIPIALRGRTLGTLKRHGRVTVRFGLRFKQPGGIARTEPMEVTLILRAKRR